MRSLFKTTIVIWSEYNGTEVELEDLAREATSGDAYCSVSKCEAVSDPESDPDWEAPISSMLQTPWRTNGNAARTGDPRDAMDERLDD